MQQSEENTGAPPTEPKRKGKIDYDKVLSQLYDNQIWSINQINKILMAFPDLINWNPQCQPNPYQFLQSLQAPQQSQPYYPAEPVIEPPPPPINPNTPTFTKRAPSAISKVEEPEKPTKPPWYKQKGIIFGIILGILMIYFIYLFYMKSTGHTVTIPGLGKF